MSCAQNTLLLKHCKALIHLIDLISCNILTILMEVKENPRAGS